MGDRYKSSRKAMQEKEVGIPDSTCIRKKAIFLDRVQAGNGKKGTEVRILIALFPPARSPASGFLK